MQEIIVEPTGAIMCICGFVCVPLLAFLGAGIAGVGAPALVAEVERAKSASETEAGDGQGESGEALQELCEASNDDKGQDPPIPKSSNGMCLLCYGMQDECGCESQGQGKLGDEVESSPEAKGPCQEALRPGLCYDAKALETVDMSQHPNSTEGMCFLCYGMKNECGCESHQYYVM